MSVTSTGALNTPSIAVVMRYPVIGEPPVNEGGTHVRVTLRSPGATARPVGGSEMVRGTITAEGADAGPMPRAFTAATRKVYEAPLVSPVTTADLPVPVSNGVCAVLPM